MTFLVVLLKHLINDLKEYIHCLGGEVLTERFIHTEITMQLSLLIQKSCISQIHLLDMNSNNCVIKTL